MELQMGRAFLLQANSLDDLTAPMQNILEKAVLPRPIGLHIVIPKVLLPLVLGSDGQGISRLQARLHVFRMDLLLLPSPYPEGRELERLLQCRGPNEGILKVINHVVTAMGPRATVSYAPLDVIHSRPTQVQIHSSSQLQLDQHTRTNRDQTTRKGHASIRNKTIKKMNGLVRQARASMRGRPT